MVEQAGALPGEADPSLSDSRAQFVASLGRRLEALREALAALQQVPHSASHRDQLRRRIHAFGAAAGVLGFDRVFEAFREAESVLGRSGPAVLGVAEIGLVARTLDLVPSLVLGAAAPALRPRGTMERRGGAFPTSVLVFGAAPLAESLSAAAVGSATLECERTEDPERAEEIVRVTAPDVAVIDADRPGARELMETLAYDPLLDPVRIIAVGTFDRPEAAATLVALGVARVLPKPVSPDALKRSVLEVSRERTSPIHRIEPIGEATIEMLADRLAQEIRRGLVEAVRPEGRAHAVTLGEGTDVLAAVWSSVARIRELVTLRSGGAVRFDSTGPEGAVPLAPWMPGAGADREQTRGGRGSERRSSDGVSLKGRTIVVVDDDPSVVWFLSGLLRVTGAEVLEAHDGSRALTLVRERWPDLVVSDILMPGLDGFALCREIKRDVALADVPVILLSWKEDLLQRARELGADADGYLRKEATASVVVQRAREVLLPRARVEARVTAGGEVRGRLDGLTPRLILEIACRHGLNAHVTIRDAAFLYEVDVRDAHVRSATRTSVDGRTEVGERALSALLGVRAGRFAVRPDETECPQGWTTDLRDLLRAPVERARAAQGLLAKIDRILRIEVDAEGLEPYLAASPQVARAVVQKLVEGESPASVVASGISSRQFESVLVDVILHGAVSRITGFAGEDLLAAQPFPGSPAVTSRAVAPVPHAMEEPSPALSPAIALPPAPSAPTITDAPKASAESPPADPAAGGASEFASFFLDSVIPPASADERREAPRALPMKALAPPTSLPPEPSPLETALRALPASATVAARRAESPSPKPVVAIPRPEPFASRVPTAPISSAPSGPPLTVKEGAGQLVQDTAKEASVATSPISTPSASPSEPPQPMPETVKEGVSRPPAAAAAPAASALTDDAAAAMPATAKEGAGARPSAAAAARGNSTPPVLPVVAPAAEPSGRPPPNPPPALTAKAEETPAIDLGAAVISALGDDSSDAPARVAADQPPVTRVDRGARGARTSAAVATRKVVRPKPAAGDGVLPSSVPTLPPSRGARTPAATRGNGGSFGIMVVVCVAGVASYALVRAVWGGGSDGSASDRSAVPVAAIAPAPTEPTNPTAAVNAAGPTITLVGPTDLDLPPGIVVERGKGLLEVDAPGAREVSVDGVIVGTAPLRQIPLAPGSHQVRLRGEGMELGQTVDIHEGRRTRLGTTNAR